MNQAKAAGQLRLSLNAVMQPFMCYGLQPFVPEVIDQIVQLAELYHRRCNGSEGDLDDGIPEAGEERA